jgi:hypothetical protein
MLNTFARWINSKAAFVLAFSLVLAGLVMGLSHAAVTLTGAHGHSATRGTSGGPCGEVLTWFAADVPLRSVNDFLLQYGAVITYGPNEEGAYQLHFPDLQTDDAVQVTSRAAGVIRARANAQCRAADAVVTGGAAS